MYYVFIIYLGGFPFSRSRFGPGNGPIHIYNTNCYKHTNLLSCQLNRVPYLYYTYCNNYREAGVRCERKLKNISCHFFTCSILHLAFCTDGKLRLTTGVSNRNGNVHMCVNGTWSLICGSGNSVVDGYLASVTCSELGYSPYGI